MGNKSRGEEVRGKGWGKGRGYWEGGKRREGRGGVKGREGEVEGINGMEA